MSTAKWVHDPEGSRWILQTAATGDRLASITLKCEYRDRTRIHTNVDSAGIDIEQLKRECESYVRETLSQIVASLDSGEPK